MSMTVMVKESVSSDGRQFHQYQENGLSPLA
jgi:hypothetical protein